MKLLLHLLLLATMCISTSANPAVTLAVTTFEVPRTALEPLQQEDPVFKRGETIVPTSDATRWEKSLQAQAMVSCTTFFPRLRPVDDDIPPPEMSWNVDVAQLNGPSPAAWKKTTVYSKGPNGGRLETGVLYRAIPEAPAEGSFLLRFDAVARAVMEAGSADVVTGRAHSHVALKEGYTLVVVVGFPGAEGRGPAGKVAVFLITPRLESTD